MPWQILVYVLLYNLYAKPYFLKPIGLEPGVYFAWGSYSKFVLVVLIHCYQRLRSYYLVIKVKSLFGWSLNLMDLN